MASILYNYEIIGAIFLLLMVYLTFYSYKRKHLSKTSMFIWFAIWIAGFLAMIFKNSLQIILPSLAVYRIFDLYTIIGFMFFLFMVFYLFRKVHENEKRIESLTRMMAMNENRNDNKENNK